LLTLLELAGRSLHHEKTDGWAKGVNRHGGI
jgi:hypothetical protein